MPFCRLLLLVVVSLGTSVLAAAEGELKLEELKEAPKGIAEKIAPLLNPNGYRISGPDGVVCEVWLAKEIPVKEDFKPTLTIKYPFLPGQIVGAIRLPTEGAALDFRGQEIPVGTYTLRYGQQPMDGNHLGTSDVSDFILACPAEADTDPKPVTPNDALFKLSAKAAGTTHPAIFLLMAPPEKEYPKAALKHDADKEFWILNLNAPTKKGKQPVQLVVSGVAEG